MLWHVVKFRMRPEVTAAERAEFTALLEGLAGAIPSLRFARVGPSIDEADVVGLLTGFDDVAGLEAYKVHEAHLPVIEMINALSVETVRLDLVTDDPSDALPLR